MNRLGTLLLPFLACLATACDETDATALRLEIEDDFSGTVRASALAAPSEPSSFQQAATGLAWESRVDIVAVAGSFASLAELSLADLSVRGGQSDDGLQFLRISLPRGEEARWPKLFVPLSPDERARAARALDPSGRSKDVGASIKIEVVLPEAVIGNGLAGRARGTRAKSEAEVATLTVPYDIATTSGDPIVWHLTWQR